MKSRMKRRRGEGVGVQSQIKPSHVSTLCTQVHALHTSAHKCTLCA